MPSVFLADISHIAMLSVTAVRKTELKILIGLCQHRLDHLAQIQLRRIVKRHNDTELDILRNALDLFDLLHFPQIIDQRDLL